MSMWPRFPPGAPLPGGVGLEVLGFPERRHLVANDLVWSKFGREFSFHPTLQYRAYREKILLR